MAPKKKAAASKETPEQLAARRAAAMAMFNTSSTPKPDTKPGASKPAPKPAAPEPKVEEQVAALDISDGQPVTRIPGDSVFSDGGDDVRKNAVAYAASTFGQGGEGLATALPAAGAGWVKMLTVEPTPAMVKNAKKQGEVETTPNGCKIHVLKDVAYLYDAEGRTNAACWRTKLEGANLGTGSQPRVRDCADKQKLLVGKNSLMQNALQTHSGAALTMLPTGHVSVLGGDDEVSVAVGLIDDLIDADGARAKEVLAALLVVAEPWGGELLVPCPDEWVGALIGKGGMGLKAIANETGCLIDYVDPEEGEGGEGDEGAAPADVSAEGGDDEGAKGPVGHFRIRGKFEKDCRLAGKRLEERLALVQRLDVHGSVMVPKGCVGRLIGKGGTNIKILQRASGASRLTFDKEPGGRATSQACGVIASDIESAVAAGKCVLEAVPLESLDAKTELNKRLEDWGAILLALTGGDTPDADASREKAVAAHRTKFGTECLESSAQTKQKPADLAAVDFDVWLWQWAVMDSRVWSDGGGRKK